MNFPQQKKNDLIISLSSFFIRSFFILLFVISNIINSFCQNFKKPGDYGFRHLVFEYQGDPVNILVRSAKDEEDRPKPLLFFCQGSLPVPLILFDEKGAFGTFPFNTDSLSKYYHIAITGKPFIPVMADIKNLQSDYCYRDSSGKFPGKYNERNLLSYYTARNLEVITFLQKQPWVTKDKLIVAGHSEGSTIAANMASQSKKITDLIYSGGNPFGRILTIITRNRGRETDSLQFAEDNFNYWNDVVQNPGNLDAFKGDNNKNMYEFSLSPFAYLENLKIPVLVSYGTKDTGATPFNDYLRVEMIRRKKTNFTYKTYLGTEHNYFGVKPDGQPDYDQFNWDRVAVDWLSWLQKK